MANSQHKVWVSIGSNIDREAMVCAAIRQLAGAFGRLRVSPVYATPATGFVGDDFYNLVAGFYTRLDFAALHARLRHMEDANGRVRSAEKFSPRTLDIDILTYGTTVARYAGKAIPNREILQYAHVLKPLADVAPDELHPQLGESYQQLWERFQGERDAMQKVSLKC